ncbi:hypothetical protein BGX33_009564 [Mortierella sp. NVP41]|nr:hypothetical protein BGX33_009564 [Mortierella sp. NVP41]
MGRPSKQQQDSASFKTRPINSYFLSARSVTNPPSPPTTLGPSSSQQSQPSPEKKSVGNTDATIFRSTATSASSESMGHDITDSLLDDPFNDPFDDPFNDHINSQDHNSWTGSCGVGEAETTRSSSDNANFLDAIEEPRAETIVELDSIDSNGLLAYGSQTSGESLRRLALSPRKPKRTLDLGHGSPGSKPTLTFSEKLTVEMGTVVSGDRFGVGNTKTLMSKNPQFGSKAEDAMSEDDAIVGGSDSGSEADWDDKDIFVSAVSTPRKIKGDEPAPVISIILSDDDIPTLSKFTSNKAPVELDDSDSDLGEDPFSNMNTVPVAPPATTPPPTTTPPKSAPKEDSFDSEVELTDYEDNLDIGSGESRAGAGSAANKVQTSRLGRTLRSTNPKPTPQYKTPIRPVSKTYKPANKPLFSLDSLLKEKERRARIGYDLQVVRNQVALDNKLLVEIDENEADEVIHSPQSIPEGVLTVEEEEKLTEIMNDVQIQTVEDIAEFFIHWPQRLVVDPLEMHLTDADSVDHIVQRVLKHTRTEVQRNQFLTSPFLTILCSSPWTMPRSLFRWLVHVVAIEQNQPVTLSVFTILQKVLSQRTSLLGVDHQDLVRIFRMYGAKEEHLDEEWQVIPVSSETKAERTIDSDTPKFPRHNLKSVLKLINLTATLDPQFYDTTEIRRITSILLRMTTDPIIGDIKSLLGATLAALLDAIPLHSWDTERNQICQETLKSLGTSSAFLLLTLHQLPSLSERVALLRRSIALAYLGQPPIPAGEIAPNIDELHRALFIDRGLQAGPNTDYKTMGRRFQIYGFCLDDEQILSGYEHKDLEPIVNKLRKTHGRIVDVRAAFMDRTLAKEVIQRIFVRLHLVMLQKSTGQGTLGFTVQGSSNTATVNIADLCLVPELEAALK